MRANLCPVLSPIVDMISQLLSEEEKTLLGAEEAASSDKKDCLIM